ncbi:TPA: hypothetical protein NKA25_002169 [Vibrio parahaemolyticus]|nr:hypothetical protein [Vibrio parahaemolyticus]
MIHNPKRAAEAKQGKQRWYDYYAGYSYSFTKSAIKSVNLSQDAVILDPWNGAGTTTLVSSQQGFDSIGIDLNPVMAIIAKAKQASVIDLEKAVQDSFSLSARYKPIEKEDDPLLVWMGGASVKLVRKIEKFILKGKRHESLLSKVDSLSYCQCIQYIALFNTVRRFLAKFIPTNPTWIKKASCDQDKVEFSWSQLKGEFISSIHQLNIDLSEHVKIKNCASTTLLISSSTSIPLQSSSVDLVLSSPPYCTRIDYAVATLPELSILSINGQKEIESIRKALMGSTTVPKSVSETQSFGAVCDSFLLSVKQHPSRASSTYYYKNFYQYFSDLFQSVKEISRVMKPDSKCFLVVQDSYYKDIHCDLAKIIIDMFYINDVEHVTSYDFESKNNMANINPRGKVYRAKTSAIETVIEFKK